MAKRPFESLRPAYRPCPNFRGSCRSMRWNLREGLVPRGYCGAIGKPRAVELVLVTAEPGDPLPGEGYKAEEPTPEAVAKRSVETLRSEATPFHSGMRRIFDMCYPGLSLEQQLRRIWRTNSVLCSARIEGGSVPTAVVDRCVSDYLRPQLEYFSGAFVVAIGRKAERRLRRHNIETVYAVHPSAPISHRKKMESWGRVARRFKRWRGT